MKNIGCDEIECKPHMHTTSNNNSCDCPGCTEQDPMDFVTKMWHKAAMEAMLEIKKDKIKAKMEAAWGESIDKAADAMLESMGKVMSATVQKSSAEGEFKNKLASIMAQAMNK